MNDKEFEDFLRRRPQEAMRLIVKAFKEKELLRIGNRSYLNAFKYPESRFDAEDLMPNGGSVQVLDPSPMLQPMTDPGKLFTDKYVIPPSSLIFKWADRIYDKRWWGQIAGGITDVAAVIQAAINALSTTGGKIFVKGGSYVPSSTIVFDVEKTKTLIFAGEGRNTVFEPTSEINVFEVKDESSVFFQDLDIFLPEGTAEIYGIYGSDAGESEICMRWGAIERVHIHTRGSNQWAINLKNPINNKFSHIGIYCPKGNGIWLDNPSTTFSGGNSTFASIWITMEEANAKGVRISSTGTANAFMNFLVSTHLHIFGKAPSVSGQIGIDIYSVRNLFFFSPIIEKTDKPFYIGGSSDYPTRRINVNGGMLHCYVTGITTTSRARECIFKSMHVWGVKSTSKVFEDSWTGARPNVFEDLRETEGSSWADPPFTKTDATIIRGIIANKLAKNRGTATIAKDKTSVEVAHGLVGTPKTVIVTGRHGETSDAIVSARDATNITITVPSAVTADRVVDWYVEM